jgi:hypothetical protein
VPRWKKGTTEFTVRVSYVEERGYQSYIPKPVMKTLGEPDAITYSIDGKRVEVKAASEDTERDKRHQPNVPVMTYEEFRDTIQKELKKNPDGLTWTELRAKLKLPQVVPNNKWVRQMEKDIGLLRVKDRRGIVWRLK